MKRVSIFSRALLLCSVGPLAILLESATATAAPPRRPPTSRPAPFVDRSRIDLSGLDDADASVRQRTLRRLQQSYPKPYYAADALMKTAAGDRDPAVRAEAIEAIGMLYSTRDARPVPADQIKSRDKAVTVLAPALGDPDSNVRFRAMMALGSIGAPAVAVAPKLAAMVKDPAQYPHQIVAGQALIRVDENGSRTLRALLPQCDAKTQYCIISALGDARTAEDRAAVAPFLKSSDPMLVAGALFSVGRMGPWDEAVVQQVEELCSAADEHVRANAVRAAGHIADPARLQRILQSAQSDPSASVQSVIKNINRRAASAATAPGASAAPSPRRPPPQGAAEKTSEDEPWQSDFPKFLSFLTEADGRASGGLDGLRNTLLDRSVRWKGTLKSFRNKRPYIAESFVAVDNETQMARVAYYVDDADVGAWEQVAPGSAVEYSGVLTRVLLTPRTGKKPFVYVTLRHVTLVMSGKR